MSQLRKRMPIVAVLLVLAGLVYTLSLDTSTPVVIVEEDDGPAPEVQAVLDTTPYHDITYTVGSIGLHFALNEEGRWIWQDDVSFPLDEQGIAQLAQDLEELSYLRSIPFSDDVLMADYGLEEPWGSLTAMRQDGTTLELLFGDASADGTTNYMIKDGDVEKALVYENSWMDVLSIPIYDMMVLPALPEITSETLHRLVVTTTVDDQEVVTALYPVCLTDGTIAWTTADGVMLENYPTLLDTAVGLTLERCFSYRPSQEALTICGFDSPVASITLSYGEDLDNLETFTFSFGEQANDTTYRYTCVGEDTTIYLVEEASITVLLELAQGLSTIASTADSQ
ncbi:DUF4340 domain-containing protein [Bengtsoniella intestinalis]|uniref:DUF4340 domain-containing protein n=1 Tax=Bengtsoniella intestinalis TaxID=3073143 RepID=UPI00391F6A60